MFFDTQNEIPYIKGMILLRVQNLQQRCTRITMEVTLAYFVDLIPNRKRKRKEKNGESNEMKSC